MPAEVPAAGLEPCKVKTFPFGFSIDSSEVKIKGALKSSAIKCVMHGSKPYHQYCAGQRVTCIYNPRLGSTLNNETIYSPVENVTFSMLYLAVDIEQNNCTI